MDDAQLRTVWHQRQFRHRTVHLSQPLNLLMQHSLGKRVSQLGKLARIWDEVLPESISEHTALESFNGGVLRVLVDSATRRYQLQMLLRAGVLEDIRERFSAGPLNRVRLVPGQFDAIDMPDGWRGEA